MDEKTNTAIGYIATEAHRQIAILCLGQEPQQAPAVYFRRATVDGNEVLLTAEICRELTVLPKPEPATGRIAELEAELATIKRDGYAPPGFWLAPNEAAPIMQPWIVNLDWRSGYRCMRDAYLNNQEGKACRNS